MKNILKLSSILLVLIGLASVSGCNTVAGFGQDLQNGGKALTNAADKHQTHSTSNSSTSSNTTVSQ